MLGPSRPQPASQSGRSRPPTRLRGGRGPTYVVESNIFLFLIKFTILSQRNSCERRCGDEITLRTETTTFKIDHNSTTATLQTDLKVLGTISAILFSTYLASSFYMSDVFRRVRSGEGARNMGVVHSIRWHALCDDEPVNHFSSCQEIICAFYRSIFLKQYVAQSRARPRYHS